MAIVLMGLAIGPSHVEAAEKPAIAGALQLPASANPATDAARAMWPDHRRNLSETFRIMPEEKYGFRPTPTQMTFAELAMHITGANMYYCRVLAPDRPVPNLNRAPRTKSELVAVLEGSLEFCAPVVAEIRDATLADELKVPSGTVTRARILLELVSGMDHHYGQAAAYLRLNGLVPPTASK